jgi:hypothetical protein
MQVYAEFSRDGKEAAVGDRSVIRLDAREKRSAHNRYAIEWAKKHKYTHYRIIQGERLQDARSNDDWQKVE